MIALIWAMDENNLIGYNNKLPWDIPEELQYFKAITLNQTILIGFNTFASLNYKSLPKRKTIVVTRKENFNIYDSNVIIINDLEKILNQYKNSQEILFVAGGKMIYEAAWNYADYLYVTIIKGKFKGDTYFFKHNYDHFKLTKSQEFEKFTTYVYERN